MPMTQTNDAPEKQKPRKKKLDLFQFHLTDKNGNATGVFDYKILQYIKKEHKLFILGEKPYLYEHGVYILDQSGAKLKTLIRNLIFPKFIKSTTIKRIYDLFISDAELQVSFGDLNCYPDHWINFRNCFYDPKNKREVPHDPKYRAVNQIPHCYNKDRKITGGLVWPWIKFICDDKDDDALMLCQFLGLCMTKDTRQQKMLVMNGDGGTGKSTVIRMIGKVIGAENISNVSLKQLSERFSAFGLRGKLLNSCADLETDALSDVSRIKQCLGEDAIRAEAKGKDAISFYNYSKMIFSTNELPIVQDEKSNGFYRRLLILTMNRKPDKIDVGFFDKLSEEIDDFIQICVKALEKMYKSGTITESQGSKDAVIYLRRKSDTIGAFLSEKTERVDDSTENRIKKADLYASYINYCKDIERTAHIRKDFYKRLTDNGYSEIKTGGIEFFKGIRFKGISPNSPQNSPSDGFMSIEDGETPFDQAS